jgi:glycosyltransferase involved in cell wall biosynthesis
VILHDYTTQSGGAERVVVEMLKRWPQAELRVLLHDPDGTFPEFRQHRVRTSVLQPLAGSVSHRALLPLYAPATRSLAVRRGEADLVISSSSGWAHGIPVHASIPHVCYCHTPARWLYDTDTYINAGRGMSMALAPLLRALRGWDRRASRRPTHYIANSQNVRRKIAAVYGRDADVLHPPANVDRFAPSPMPRDGYLLVLSRLLGYKRVDLAIEAGACAGLPIVVAGDGPERASLEAMAGGRARFLGRVPDADLPALFAGSRAFFLGGEEDFGITPLEANAAGRPVVAFAKGGALETVRDGVSGVLFEEQTADSAADGLRRAMERDWDPWRLADHAGSFRSERFLDQLQETVQRRFEPARPSRRASRFLRAPASLRPAPAPDHYR